MQTKKVHYFLKSLDIHAYQYCDELLELQDNILELGESMRRNMLKVSNMDDDLSRCKYRNEERRIIIKHLELEINRMRNDICIFTNDNHMLTNQRNIFCLIVKRFYKPIRWTIKPIS